MSDRDKTRAYVRAVVKVAGEQRAELCRVGDQLLLEYLKSGGRFVGTEFGKQLTTWAYDGGDLSRALQGLLNWLERELDKPASKGA